MNRARYKGGQFNWMKSAHAGSSAIRQFGQWQPRYSHAEAEKMLADGESAQAEEQ